MRILVVEDDVPLACRIGSALAGVGHDLIIVHDGEGALDTSFSTTSGAAYTSSPASRKSASVAADRRSSHVAFSHGNTSLR